MSPVCTGKPYYIMALGRKKALIELSRKKAVDNFLARHKVNPPGNGMMLIEGKANKAVHSKIRKMDGSLIYTKDKGPRAILGIGD